MRPKAKYEKALHDLNGAKILFEHEGGYDLVAFHCQQAIEKHLKGWLLKTTNALLDGHNLVFLCRKAIQAGAPLRENLRDCAYVNQFYIETRYPADSYIPVSKDEALDCLDTVEMGCAMFEELDEILSCEEAASALHIGKMQFTICCTAKN